MTAKQELEALIQELPPDALNELQNLARTLKRRHAPNEPRKLTQSWGGGLSHLRDQYDSVELQHCANQWRLD